MTAGIDKKVAFLGMGIMGASMAQNLARAGYKTKVWNRTPGKPGTEKAVHAGCLSSKSLKDCVMDADYVFSCLGDVADVKEVLIGAEGVSKFAPTGTLVVDFSTIGPSAAIEIGQVLSDAKLQFLDAPITGGDVGAQQGTLTIMVGGAKSDFDRVKPCLEVMGKTVELCGGQGAGQALKLCNQVLCSVNMIAVSEAINLAKDFDLEPELVINVLKDGAGGSWALSNLGSRIVKDDLKPGFMLKHMIKDLRLVHENLGTNGSMLPGMEMAESMFKQLVEEDKQALEALGTQAMIKVYQK